MRRVAPAGCAAACAWLALAALAPAAEWKLVWSDEFNYTGLPSRAKWDYETGFVRNHEKQFYTRDRLENARVEKGMLVIEGRKEAYRNAQYTAASLITAGKASWRYGRIEVRAQLPRGKGVWPAIWMLGTNMPSVGWPRCGEIDIMEFVGHDPNRVHATVHFAEGGRHASAGGKLETPAPSDGFHLYAVEWDRERMAFYFDQTKYFTFELDRAGKGDDNPFRKPHYLLINLALGGTWGGAIDDAVLPQAYRIDYVRIYARRE